LDRFHIIFLSSFLYNHNYSSVQSKGTGLGSNSSGALHIEIYEFFGRTTKLVADETPAAA
jgi:hypothetical protein